MSHLRIRVARSTTALSLALIGTLAAAGCTAGSSADRSGESAGITMSGTGTVSGTPDTLRATVAAMVLRDSVEEGLDAANEVAQRLIDTARDGGVADEDIQTEQFSINPRFEFDDDSRSRTISGYEVTNRLTIKIRDLDSASALLDAVGRAGGNDAVVDSVGFSLEDNADLIRQARDRAFEDARQSADQYAELAGRNLGDVVSIVEELAPAPQPFRADDMLQRSEGSVPLEPGTENVEVRVTVRWLFN